MDLENAIAEEKPHSLFQVDQMFMKKILGRKSVQGNSMRMFYAENVAAVPFQWEAQPGTPKHPQTETIPPLSPPPAVHSQTLKKPAFASSHATMSCFRRSKRRSKKGKAKGQRKGHASSEGERSPESLESSDSKPSSDHSRSSSSSSSFSTTSSSSSSSSSLRSLAKGLWVKLAF